MATSSGVIEIGKIARGTAMFFSRLSFWMIERPPPLTDWAKKNGVTVFVFEAFDEPWKGTGTEGHWGLFTVDRKALAVHLTEAGLDRLVETFGDLFAVGNGLSWPTFQSRVAELGGEHQGVVQGASAGASRTATGSSSGRPLRTGPEHVAASRLPTPSPGRRRAQSAGVRPLSVT